MISSVPENLDAANLNFNDNTTAVVDDNVVSETGICENNPTVKTPPIEYNSGHTAAEIWNVADGVHLLSKGEGIRVAILDTGRHRAS